MKKKTVILLFMAIAASLMLSGCELPEIVTSSTSKIKISQTPTTVDSENDENNEDIEDSRTHDVDIRTDEPSAPELFPDIDYSNVEEGAIPIVAADVVGFDTSDKGEQLIGFDSTYGCEEPVWCVIYEKDYDFFRLIEEYKGYLAVDLQYKEEDGKNVIISYRCYVSETGEDVMATITEEGIRQKVGLPLSGTYTEELTLSKNCHEDADIEVGDGTKEMYVLLFENEWGCIYDVRVYDEELQGYSSLLEEDEKYTITYEVAKDDTWGYTYVLQKIKGFGEDKE